MRLAVLAALLLWPGLAAACPACARDGGNGPAQWALLGAMILFPFAVSAVVIGFIRREGRPERTLTAGTETGSRR